MPYRISHFMPILRVDDIDAAIDFFCKLGWSESFRYPFEASPTSHAGVKSGECSIMFALVEKEPGDAAIPPQNVYTFVEDVDAYYTHCAEAFSQHGDTFAKLGAGQAALGTPEDFDYDMRDFDLTDPWGHRITFGEGLERIEAREKSST